MRAQALFCIEGPIIQDTQRKKNHQSLRVYTNIPDETTGKLTNLLDDSPPIGAAVDHEGIINHTRYTCTTLSIHDRNATVV